MGYDFHIVRKSTNRDLHPDAITQDEWQTAVSRTEGIKFRVPESVSRPFDVVEVFFP